MNMLNNLQDKQLHAVLSLACLEEDWRPSLQRIIQGDTSLDRHSAQELAVKAIQRILIFLGYSTATTGAFLIDGDFGRGTNRGLAQFQYEYDLTDQVDSKLLSYPCSYQTARKRIISIPDVRLTVETLDILSKVCLQKIRLGQITLGNFDDALFHLNALHEGHLLTCTQIVEKYGDVAIYVANETNILPEWILAIIRQESAGVIRPRFEQHKLSRAYHKSPDADFAELRIASMSIGLGQIMGFNYKAVGATSATSMLNAPIDDQIHYIGQFLRPIRYSLQDQRPDQKTFNKIARFYNGPAYASHFYHEKIEKWFLEFKRLLRT